MTPEGLLTYAVGDVHGHFEKLAALINHCRQHSGGRPTRLVFVGDYVDRGPDSRAVINYLIDLQRTMPRHVVCLRGNHEEDMLACARGGDQSQWLANGGRQTLASYGIGTAQDIPAEHLEWAASLPLTFDDGLRLFVHAGLRPDVPVEDQRLEDLLWIREPFLSDERDYGRLIVHGHTPTWSREPDQRSNRLNVDTAAGYGGPLTAAAFSHLETGPVAFLKACSVGRAVTVDLGTV